MTPREHGSGSMYQRTSDWRWIATIDRGTTTSGARRRIPVTSKGCVNGCAPRCPHRAEIKRKLERKKAELQRGDVATGRKTVKAWAEEYLAMRVRDLSPKGYNAAASPIRKWVIPTIGHRRLEDLTPRHLREVADAQRAAGLKGSTAAATHRATLTMLRKAVLEGHHVPGRIFLMEGPVAAKSDRQGMSIEEGLALIRVAGELPHGARWLHTLIYGCRQGESLGLTWDAIDFDAGVFAIEWQLQAFPYIDRANKTCGFRVPDDIEARHLVDAYHLKRPKSKAGIRIAPLLPVFRDALLAWREIAPPNPYGLVWPNAAGQPANNKHDLEEWHAIQGTAGVSHPARTKPHPYYHVHECRNFAATVLGEAEVDRFVIQSLLGHSDAVTSEGYRNVPLGPLREAINRAGERLQLG